MKLEGGRFSLVFIDPILVITIILKHSSTEKNHFGLENSPPKIPSETTKIQRSGKNLFPHSATLFLNEKRMVFHSCCKNYPELPK